MAHCQTGQAPRAEPPELAEVLDRHAFSLPRLSHDQARVVSALIACRTAALGGHLRRCDNVFTLPHCLNPLFRRDQRLAHRLLFDAATATLIEAC